MLLVVQQSSQNGNFSTFFSTVLVCTVEPKLPPLQKLFNFKLGPKMSLYLNTIDERDVPALASGWNHGGLEGLSLAGPVTSEMH